MRRRRRSGDTLRGRGDEAAGPGFGDEDGSRVRGIVVVPSPRGDDEMLHLRAGKAACADCGGIHVDGRELVAGVGREARYAPPLDESDSQIAVDADGHPVGRANVLRKFENRPTAGALRIELSIVETQAAGIERRSGYPLRRARPPIEAHKAVAGGDQQRRPWDGHRDRRRQRHAFMALGPPLEAVKKTVLDVDPVERVFRAGPLP